MAAVRYRFHTMEFADTDIHFRTLRDRQQFDDPEGITEALGVSPASWPLFGVVWAAGEVLAHRMDCSDLQGRRVLEVGCGIGLASLIMNQQQVDITASDYNPDAGEFLAYNTRLNNSPDIPFVCSDWSSKSANTASSILLLAVTYCMSQTTPVYWLGLLTGMLPLQPRRLSLIQDAEIFRRSADKWPRLASQTSAVKP